MEFLNDQPSLVRIVGPFQKALEKLGVQLIYRVVDFSLSKQKMDAFDFETTSLRLPGTTAPGGDGGVPVWVGEELTACRSMPGHLGSRGSLPVAESPQETGVRGCSHPTLHSRR